MKRNLSCEMFRLGTCEGCKNEQFDNKIQSYYCLKYSSVLGGTLNNHPMKLLFCDV